ncbi:MAG: hypothetical protein ACKPKO_07775, partial [Candidatus Fonsibacter sp.]
FSVSFQHELIVSKSHDHVDGDDADDDDDGDACYCPDCFLTNSYIVLVVLCDDAVDPTLRHSIIFISLCGFLAFLVV